jgi:rubredoxin
MTQNTNPLQGFYRSPKLYVGLPTQGIYYDDTVVDLPENRELAVYSMTARDEMIMKNPDALLNGEAVAQVIKSCVPQVKAPRAMISNDVETLLVAIQSATHGDEMDINATCPECNAAVTGTASIEDSLSTMQVVEQHYVLETANGLEIEVRPYSYESSVKAGIANFQSTRSLQSIGSITDEMAQLKAFNDSFMKLSALNFDLIVDSVSTIAGTDPEGEDFVVKDRNAIREFMENCDSDVGHAVQDKISEINEIGINKTMRMKCEECEHEFDHEVGFDPVNFFIASSRQQTQKKS